MWEEQSSQPSTPASSSKKTNSSMTKYALYAGIAVVVLILVGTSGYFYIQYQSAQKLLAGGNASAEQVQQIVDKVGKLVELPKGEKPTLASVTDKFKLINQPFFAKAENGDQVVIFAKNKTAILYRPSTNKIINYATGVTIGQGSTNTTPTPAVAGAQTEISPTEAPSPTIAPTKVFAKPTVKPTEEPSPTAAQ